MHFLCESLLHSAMFSRCFIFKINRIFLSSIRLWLFCDVTLTAGLTKPYLGVSVLYKLEEIQGSAHGLTIVETLKRLVLSRTCLCSIPQVTAAQALNTEDNNPTPVQLCSQCSPLARIWRNLFRAFLFKARNGDTAGWPFGWLAIKSGFEKGQNSCGRLWLMRLEGLAPTYSVDTAEGESDSIENQRVSTKFSRHALPTSTFSMLPNQDWSG